SPFSCCLYCCICMASSMANCWRRSFITRRMIAASRPLSFITFIRFSRSSRMATPAGFNWCMFSPPLDFHRSFGPLAEISFFLDLCFNFARYFFYRLCLFAHIYPVNIFVVTVFSDYPEIHRFSDGPPDVEAFRQLFNHFYIRSEEHTSELQSRENLVCRLLLE